MGEGDTFCSRCGTKIEYHHSQEGFPSSKEWDHAANCLGNGTLSLAKGFTVILIAGAAVVCGLAAAGMLGAACYMFFHFANHLAMIFPWLLTGKLSGIPLLFAGIIAAFSSILLMLATFALIRCIGSLRRRSPVKEKNIYEKMEDADMFCSNCGTNSFSNNQSFGTSWTPEIKKEPIGKLGCELAYAGTLFWVPLLICPKEKHAKFCANQGLWVLICSVAACSMIRILGALNELLSGKIFGILFGGVYSLLFIAFLFLMLYLVWQCVKNALSIHRDEEPSSILFFDKVQIIH